MIPPFFFSSAPPLHFRPLWLHATRCMCVLVCLSLWGPRWALDLASEDIAFDSLHSLRLRTELWWFMSGLERKYVRVLTSIQKCVCLLSLWELIHSCTCPASYSISWWTDDFPALFGCPGYPVCPSLPSSASPSTPAPPFLPILYFLSSQCFIIKDTFGS